MKTSQLEKIIKKVKNPKIISKLLDSDDRIVDYLIEKTKKYKTMTIDEAYQLLSPIFTDDIVKEKRTAEEQIKLMDKVLQTRHLVYNEVNFSNINRVQADILRRLSTDPDLLDKSLEEQLELMNKILDSKRVIFDLDNNKYDSMGKIARIQSEDLDDKLIFMDLALKAKNFDELSVIEHISNRDLSFLGNRSKDIKLFLIEKYLKSDEFELLDNWNYNCWNVRDLMDNLKYLENFDKNRNQQNKLIDLLLESKNIDQFRAILNTIDNYIPRESRTFDEFVIMTREMLKAETRYQLSMMGIIINNRKVSLQRTTEEQIALEDQILKTQDEATLDNMTDILLSYEVLETKTLEEQLRLSDKLLQSCDKKQLATMTNVATNEKVLKERTTEEHLAFLDKLLQANTLPHLVALKMIETKEEFLENRTFEEQMKLIDVVLSIEDQYEIGYISDVLVDYRVLEKLTLDEQLSIIDEARKEYESYKLSNPKNLDEDAMIFEFEDKRYIKHLIKVLRENNIYSINSESKIDHNGEKILFKSRTGRN